MSHLKLSFTEFQYDQKPLFFKTLDFCNQGVYTLFQSKRIHIYKAEDSSIRYQELLTRSYRLSLLISSLVFPLLLMTIPLKILIKEKVFVQWVRKTNAAIKIQRMIRRLIIKNKTIKKIFQSMPLKPSPHSFYLSLLKNRNTFRLIKWSCQQAQYWTVKCLFDAWLIQVCQPLGINPYDVKMGMKIDALNEGRYNF